MRIYHYNLRYETVKQSIVLSPAEARGITKITVKLRTKEDKHFNVLYFIADEQAELFKEQLTEYYKKGAKRWKLIMIHYSIFV